MEIFSNISVRLSDAKQGSKNTKDFGNEIVGF
jgi:hypothetical protein